MKLNPDPFEALGKHWEKSQELVDTWLDAAKQFWTSYADFVKLLNERNDTKR